MHYCKLLPLPLLIIGFQNLIFAEPFELPTISVDGVSGEAAPYVALNTTVTSPDTGDLIKRLPGSNINSNGAITSIPQYRGLFGNRVNVLIDGVNLHEAGPNSMDSALNYLPSSRVENVAIYRGIAPVGTGIETIGGTMMITSKKAEFTNSDKTEFHGSASAGYAENGNIRYNSLTTSVVTQNHLLQIAGSSDRGDNLEFAGGYIVPNKHKRNSLAVRYAAQKGGNNLELTIEHHDTGLTGTASLPMDIILIRGENYKAAYHNHLDNGATISAQLHYQAIDHQMDNYTLRNTSTPMRRFATPELAAGDIRLSYRQDNWTIGFDADQATHNATVFNPDMAAFFIDSFKDVKRDRYSLFIQWHPQTANDWKLNTGLRYSRVNMDADAVNSVAGLPSAVGILQDRFNAEDRNQNDDLLDLVLNLTHTLSTNADLEFGFARKTRAPSYQERYLWIPLEITAGLADGNNYVGDVNLDHEVAYQFELGLDWHSQQTAISPRIFYHLINDYIQGVAGITDMPTLMVSGVNGDASPLQYSNVDVKLYGIDANWFVALSNRWQLDGVVSYVRGKRRDTSDNLYRIAPLTASTMLSYVQNKWRVGVQVTAVASQNKISSENSEQTTNGYAVFNLGSTYQPTPYLMLTAGINNLFDRYYDNHLAGYNRISDNPDIAQGDHLPGPGRSAYVGVNINW